MPDTYTYPETYSLNVFLGDLRASNIVWHYADTPQRMIFLGNRTLTNEAKLLLVANECITFNSINVKVLKSQYTGSEILSDLIKQLAALLPTPSPAPAASSAYSALHLGDAAEVIGSSIVVASGAIIQGVQPATYSDSPVQFGQFVTIANELDASTKAVSAAAKESIAQCVSDRLASEATINASIVANATTAASAVSSEAAAREAADTSLQTQIDSHTAKLDIITASPNILQSFNGVKDFVDKLKEDEQASLTSAVVTLTTSIGNEATRATSAEASLQTALDSLTSSVSTQISAVTADYDGQFATVSTTLSKVLAFLKSIDQDLYSQYSLAPVSSSRVISHTFGLVQGGDIQMYGPAGPSDPSAIQIVLVQNANWSDAGQQNYTGWTIKSDCLPEYTTITGFRFDYSNYSSMFRCVYVDLSAPINGNFNGNNTFIITP